MRTNFTLVTPSFNKVRFIRDTIESIHQQTGATWEHIVLDAGSTDGTNEVIKPYLTPEYQAELASRGCSFKWVQEKDRGQSHAINKGMFMAQGSYLAWLNADDIYYPDTLRRVLRYFESHPDAMLIYGDMNYLNTDGTVKKLRCSLPHDRGFLLNGLCYIAQPSTFWRREVLSIAGLLDCQLHLAMDYEYWLRCSQYFHLHHVKATFSGLRLMADTKTGLSPNTAMPEVLRVNRRYGARYFCTFRFSYWLWGMGLAPLVRFVGRKIIAWRYNRG